jgi:peroxiredoxin
MRRLLYLFITVLIISCNENNPNSYQLEGTALGYDDGTQVYYYEIDGNNQSKVTDTLEVINGKFSASYPKIDDTALHFIRVGNGNANILFFVENENIKATIYKDSIQASFVSGGKQNELYVEYQKESAKTAKKRLEITKALNQAQLEQDGIVITERRQELNALSTGELAFKRKFVRENGSSLFGLMLLSEMFSNQEIPANEVIAILDGLGPKMAANELAANLRASIESKKQADIGYPAPDFTAATPNGEQLALKDALGKYTIIDFWASWCRPCRMENPNVVNVYNKYHDKGLNIISVSLDKAGQEDRWKKAIADDKMNWYHVSNLKFWQDPIARQYNVRSIPATFLLDENGIIIDKNLRGPALGQKIGSLLD